MSIQFVGTLTVTIYLLLPGYLFLLAAGIQRNHFLLAYGISISTLVLSLHSVLLLQAANLYLFLLLHLAILVLTTGIALYYRTRRINTNARKVLSQIENKQAVIWYLLLILAYCTYHAIVGPYTEIPSDFWKHLARVGIEHSHLVSGDMRYETPRSYLDSGSSLIYMFLALVAHMLAVDPIDLVPAITLVTSSVFLTAIYWFSISIFRRYFSDHRWVLIGACLTTILTFISFGTATFSYARYYAYFPTIFGFPLVYASIVIFVNFLERPQSRSGQLFLIPLFLATMTLIHRQEALLTIVILGGIAVVRSVRSLLPLSNLDEIIVGRARISACFFLGLFIIVVIYTFTTQEITDWHNTPHVLDAGYFAGFLSGLPIDNPSFRLWDTLGIFGIVVYVWAILNWRIIGRSDYLIAGLLVPIFTNLNPLYANVFLHFGSPTSLWRTAYLIPLPIVAALLICCTFSNKTPTKGLGKRSRDIVLITCLLISLLPWSFQGYYNRTSRVPSLMPVHTRSGAGLWLDLTERVRAIEHTQRVRRIFTDEITKFVLYTANRGEIWWWPQHEYFPKHRKDYKEDFSQSDLTESLLVVNRRNGVTTASAEHARHWPAQILNVARHYPKDLDTFLFTHKDHFKLLWEFDRIAVYQMSTFYD